MYAEGGVDGVAGGERVTVLGLLGGFAVEKGGCAEGGWRLGRRCGFEGRVEKVVPVSEGERARVCRVGGGGKGRSGSWKWL